MVDVDRFGHSLLMCPGSPHVIGTLQKVSNNLSRITKCIGLKPILNGFQNSFYHFCSLILTGETGL